MRLKAYILIADPAWIEASVLSYYDLVDEIVASFDEDRMGYTGVPVAVDECLDRLRAIDRDRKIRLSPGHYARPEHTPMENETHQRRCALAEAGRDADWVLQLDTDEIVPVPATFLDCLGEADARGDGAMEYPSRWLYRQLGRDRFLESCSRFGGVAASFPGPLAVRAGTELRLARQCDAPTFRVDFRPRNTDPWRPKDAPVHRAVPPSHGVVHYSWVRDESKLRKKMETYSHAKDRDWSSQLDHWAWSGRHPLVAALVSPLARGQNKKHYRIVTIAPADAASAEPWSR